MRKYRWYKRHIKNSAVDGIFDGEIPDECVVTLYFDPPEGISREELDERKRMRMFNFPTGENLIDFVFVDDDSLYFGNASELIGSKKFNLLDDSSCWTK